MGNPRLSWKYNFALSQISPLQSTAAPQSSALAAFRSVGLLDVLYLYDCGGLGRKPCQDGACDASLRQALHCAWMEIPGFEARSKISCICCAWDLDLDCNPVSDEWLTRLHCNDFKLRSLKQLMRKVDSDVRSADYGSEPNLVCGPGVDCYHADYFSARIALAETVLKKPNHSFPRRSICLTLSRNSTSAYSTSNKA